MELVRPKIILIDGRHTGHHWWKYYIDFPRRNPLSYSLWRVWCWETWGPSTDLSLMQYGVEHDLKNPCTNAHWCWHTDDKRNRLYLKTDVEHNLFALRWL